MKDYKKLSNFYEVFKEICNNFTHFVIPSLLRGGFKLPKPGDARTIPSDGLKGLEKFEEGRGVSAKDLFGGKKGTNYEFSTKSLVEGNI